MNTLNDSTLCMRPHQSKAWIGCESKQNHSATRHWGFRNIDDFLLHINNRQKIINKNKQKTPQKSRWYLLPAWAVDDSAPREPVWWSYCCPARSTAPRPSSWRGSAAPGPCWVNPARSTPRWSRRPSSGRSDRAPWRGSAIPAAVSQNSKQDSK